MTRVWPLTGTKVGIVLLLFSGCAAPPSPLATATGQKDQAPPAVERLLQLMRERLSLMHDVARSKWNTKKPISDPQREEALLREMERNGQALALPVSFVRAFFTAQIAAAKQVQEADLAAWRTEKRGPFDDTPDLAFLRDRINERNQELLDLLPEVAPLLAQPEIRDRLRVWAEATLTGEGITPEIRTTAMAGLEQAGQDQ